MKRTSQDILRFAAFIAAMYLSPALAAQIEQLSVRASDELGAGFNADIDIVFVYSESTLNRLPYEQFAWISTRGEQIATFADTLGVVQVSVTATTDIAHIDLPTRQGEAVAVLVFASHEDPITEGIDITGETHLTLVIEPAGVSVAYD